MWIINAVIGKVFEILFLPFKNMNPWFGMILVSLLTAILMLVNYKYTSNQQGIKKAKNKIKAHLLELRLFKDSFGISLRAQGNMFLANLKYLSYQFKPLLFMIVPLVLIIIHINFWFAYDSLKIDEKTLVKVRIKSDFESEGADIVLETSPGIVVETPPLRIEEEKEIDWRISAVEKGLHELTVSIDGKKTVKKVSVRRHPLSRISPLKLRGGNPKLLLYPAEKPIPPDSPVGSIEVVYPERNLSLFGGRIHWLIPYFILSIVFAFALKGLFKVDI